MLEADRTGGANDNRSMTERLRDESFLFVCRSWVFMMARHTLADGRLVDESYYRLTCDCPGWPRPQFSGSLRIFIEESSASRRVPTAPPGCGTIELLTRWGDEEVAEEGNVIYAELAMAAREFEWLAAQLAVPDIEPTVQVKLAEPLVDGQWPYARKIPVVRYDMNFKGGRKDGAGPGGLWQRLRGRRVWRG
jgi:hypothetical protein